MIRKYQNTLKRRPNQLPTAAEVNHTPFSLAVSVHLLTVSHNLDTMPYSMSSLPHARLNSIQG